MAKFRPAKAKKAPAVTRPNAVGCIILLALLFLLLFLMMYYTVRQA
jgi:hypothetical protein